MKRVRMYRWKGGKLSELDDTVAEEAFLRLRVNGRLYRRVAISPEAVRPFVVGHLRGEGLISSPSEIERYAESQEQQWIFVDVELPGLANAPELADTLWTGCGAPPAGTPLPQSARWALPFTLPGEHLLRVPLLIKDHVQAFTATGAYHYAFLLDQHLSLRQVTKDIGRHNAVDKAVGQEFLQEGNLSDCFLYLTGRLTQDVVAKCLRCGIPLAVSKAAPLAGAISLARRHGLGLVGFLRGRRFNVYSRPELIS
ncbi:MAG: formate dehydrogenase accessory sulfurtransferase FdhD [Candidatus Bipolaricaulota bacterium]